MEASFIVYEWICAELSGVPRDVFAIIYSYSRGQNGCYYGGVKTIADLIHVTTRSVQEALRKLETEGFITRTPGQHGRGHTDDYVAIWEKGENFSPIDGEKRVKIFPVKGEDFSEKGENFSFPCTPLNNKPIRKDNKRELARDARATCACEKYGEFVSMTADEYGKLVAEYGAEKAAALISMLDNYKGSSGKKYKSDYRAILSWVVDRYDEQQRRQPARRPETATPREPANDFSIYANPDNFNR